MCTNETDIIFEYDFKDESVISDLKLKNNFIEIFSKVGNKWKKECYLRDQLIDMLTLEYDNTITLWGNCELDERVKMVGKLPLSNELILERSVRFIHNNRFSSFIKTNCAQVRVGSYFGVSTLHGTKENVCRLVPISEGDGDNSFTINVEGLPSKRYNYSLSIIYGLRNPINNSNENGLYIGQVYYYKDGLDDFLTNLSIMLNVLYSSINNIDNKTEDHKILLKNIPKIMKISNNLTDGLDQFEILKLELDLIKPSIRNYENEIKYIYEIDKILENKTKYVPHGYGEWIYFKDMLSSCNYVNKNIDTEPIRKEIRGYWQVGKIYGASFMIQSDKIDTIYNKLIYKEEETILERNFSGVKINDEFIINEIVNGVAEEITGYSNFVEAYDVRMNRFTLESILKQEILIKLIYMYMENNNNDIVKELISLLLSMNVNPLEMINILPNIDNNSLELYTYLLEDEWIVSKLTVIKSYDQYYYSLVNKLISIIDNPEIYIDEYIITSFLEKIPSDIKKSYKHDGETILHFFIKLLERYPELVYSSIRDMVNKDNVYIGMIDSKSRTIFHYVFYYFEDVMNKLNIDIKIIERLFENIIYLNGVDVNLRDNNGLTILHQAVMITSHNTEKLVKIILDKNPDLTIKSLYPLEATPLETAIMFNQPNNIIKLLRDKQSPKERNTRDIKVKVSNLFDVESKVEEDIPAIHRNLMEEFNQEEKEVEEKEQEDSSVIRSLLNDFNEEYDEFESVLLPSSNEMVDIISNIKNARTILEIETIINGIDDNVINMIKDNQYNYIGHAIILNPLMRNVQNYNEVIRIFRILISREFIIDITNEYNDTPLSLFIKYLPDDVYSNDFYRFVDIFINEFRTNINQYDSYGYSILYHVVSRGNKFKDIVRLLLEKGAVVDDSIIKLIDEMEIENVNEIRPMLIR